MKKPLLFIALIVAAIIWNTNPGSAQDKHQPPASAYEYAIIKWDGPDRLFCNLPDKFELMHISKNGVTIPREANEEEFYLAYAANNMAKQGWETVTLDSRRIVLRRAK